MRKIYFLLVTILCGTLTYAQSTANYAVTSTNTGSLALDMNGNVVDMSSGTTQVVAGSQDDFTPTLQTIGFSFTFMGTVYTQFSAGSNGVIRLGASTLSSTQYTVGSSSMALIAPFGGDLETSSTGKVHFKVVGSGSNRTLVVEFLNMGIDFTGSPYANPDGTFQVRLYEATGVIQFVYGSMNVNSSTVNSTGFTIGFSSGSATNNIMSITNTSTNAFSTSAVTILTPTRPTGGSSPYPTLPYTDLTSSSDGSRKTYVFTPAVAAAPINLTFTNVAATSMTINWTDNSTNESAFTIARSPDGITYTDIATVSSTTTAATGGPYSYTATGLTPGTNHFWKVTALGEGGASAGLTGSQSTLTCTTTGNFTIDNSIPVSATNFTSFTSAINYLNGFICAITSNITVNVAAGQTFTEDVPALTTGGNATGRIIFQKSGVGANPVIRPTGTAGANDFGFALSGSDYVTIDGIDINIATGSAVEYGILVRNASATDGAQNNIIKNTSITLNRTNTSSRGIMQTTTTTGGGVTPTAASGANSNNIYQNLTIKNVYSGIYLNGTAAFPDLGVEVGTTACGTYNTIGDAATANDIGNSSSQAWGIRAANQQTVKIYNNIVSNVTASTTVDGIFVETFLGNSQVYNNRISGIRNSSTSSTSGATGLRATHTITGTLDIKVYNNTINNITSGYTGSATATRVLKGILLGSGGGTTQTYYIDFNSVNIDGSASLNVSSAAFEIASTSGPVMLVRNNIFANNTAAQGAVARHYSYVSTSATAIGPAGSLLQYNDLFVANDAGVSGFTSRGNTTDYTTVANTQAGFTTPAGGAANNISTSPDFTADMHTTSPALNGVANSTGITWVTTDMDCATRNAPTDIGADEFTPPALDIALTAFTAPGGIRCFTATEPVTVTIKNMAGSTIDFSVNPVTVTVVVSGAATTTYNVTLNSGTLASAATQTVNLGNLNMTTSGTYTFTSSISLAGDAVAANNSLAAVNVLSSPLSGTYTVGAAGTFTTLTQAVAAYNNATCFPANVVFELLDPSYSTAETFPITINANSAAGTKTLTIRPAAGVNATITGSSATSLIKLNGADYVIIDGSNNATTSRNLTITNTSTATSGNAVIWLASPALGNGANNNIIKNTIIEGNSATTTFLGVYIGGSTSISLTAAGSDKNNNNTVTNNLFRKTQYGIALFGFAAATPDDNNLITDNQFGTSVAGEGFNVEGIHTDRQNLLVVSGNDVQNIRGSGSTDMYGIRLLDFKSGQAFRNKVHNMAYTGTSITKIYGLAVQSASYTAVGTPSNALIHNNLVYDITSTGTSATWNLTGMFAGQGYGDKYYYNTIHLTGQLNNSTSGLSAAFANGDANITTFGTVLDVRNNIFNITGTTGGPVWAYYSRAASLTTSTQNYNLLNAAATGGTNYIGRMNSVNYSTLATWSAASTKDVNSISTDPMLNSNTNLVPFPGSPVINAGTPIAAVTTDFPGVTRTGNTSIGAYEVAADLVGPAISFTPLTGSCNTGDRNISATIVDAGGIATGVNAPRIYFRKNGGAWISQQGTFGSGTSTNAVWNFTITSALLGGVVLSDNIEYYIVAQDVAGNMNSNAPGATGPIAANLTAPSTLNAYIVSGTLSGVYTVGATGMINTLSNAARLYSAGCPLGGPVTFSLIDANYSTGETFPIIINPNANANSVNTLTIKPATGVNATITGSASSVAVMILNGTDFITIDGSNTAGGTSRNLTISGTNTGSGTVALWIASQGAGAGATNVTVKNSIIESGTRGSNTVTTFGIFAGSNTGAAAGADNDNLTIQNNIVRRALYGIQAIGDAAGQLDNLVITGNTVGDDVDANTVGRYGMYLSQATGANVSKNTVKNVLSTDSGNPTGIYLGTAFTNSVIDGNTITNIRYTGTGGYGGRGIDVSTGTASSNLVISNNMISEIKGDGWSSFTSDAIIGIRLYNASAQSGIKLLNNTVNLGSGSFAGNTSGTLSAALYVGSTNTNLDIRNNIFATNLVNTAVTAKTYAIYSAAASTAYTAIDNNDYYVSGTQGVLGFLGSDRVIMDSIRISFGQNTNSLNVAPVFMSASDVHLQTDANCALDGTGTPVAEVSIDIDGQTRNATTPDIGADEFTGTFTLVITNPAVCSPAMVNLTLASVTAGSTSGGVLTYYTDAAATTPVATPSAVAAGTYYIKLVKGSCSQILPVTAIVDPVSVAGTISSSQVLCSSQTPANLTLSGNTGSVNKWQRSTSSNFTTGVTDISNTTTTLTGASIGALTATTYFRAIVTSGVCSADTTVPVTITVNQPVNITTQPSAQTVCPGTNPGFTVVASNATAYQWKKDGVDIVGATSATLNLTNVSASDVASYTVVVTGMSPCSNVTSSAAALALNPVTAINTQPANQAACPGGNVTFTVAATGTGTLTYQWRKNSTNIIGATSASYSITGVTAADAASYDVIVTGSCGSVTSSSATLSLNSAAINSAPTAQTVCAGSPASFTVVASGVGTLTYQWRKNSTNIAGATSATYTIASTVAANAGNYDVVITGSCGSITSTPVSLTVNPVTTITVNPVSQGACIGGNASFTVTATGTGTLTYQWRKGTVNIPGATSATYTITGVTASSAANYDVIVTGGCGTATSTPVPLTINPATAITTQPLAQTRCIGGNATFTVAANGSGTLTYQWRKGGSNIAGATSSSYTITGLVAGDAANYDVIVTGNCGSVTSAAVALTINPATVITTQPVAQTICALNQASFTVAATGTGTLTYQWRKNSVNIAGATSATYTIASAATGDAGNYDVVITSTCGTLTSASVALVVNACTALPSVDEDITSASLMPNIVNQNTLLRVVARRAMKVDWTVIDAKGRVVMQFSQSVSSGQNDIRIEAGKLASGTYFLSGTTRNGKIKTIRFVRQ